MVYKKNFLKKTKPKTNPLYTKIININKVSS